MASSQLIKMDKKRNSKVIFSRLFTSYYFWCFDLQVPSKKGKKGKKNKKKVDKNLTGEAAETAKKELISSLMSKCNMSEEQGGTF